MSASAPRIAVLIVAAGSGVRLGGPCPKQYRDLLGVPILVRTVQAFAHHPRIDAVHVVIGADHDALYATASAGLDLPPPVIGGATRQESVLRGLEALAAATPPDLVLIHDAARPLVTADSINRVIAALAEHDGAIAALPAVDTLWRADAAGQCTALVERTGLWRAQTPQGFHFAAILGAHRAAAGQALTDDAAVARAGGLSVALVAGDEEAMKITTQDDMTRAEAVLLSRLADIRVGTGFDVHKFQPGDHVVLCGVRVPHNHGLEGHSDADVGLHALTDAILGALADGDIGSHFPPSDAQWKGADSARFLRHAAALVAARGGIIANVDITILAERPKVGPHRDAMRARIAEILGIPVGRVGVKATTTEGLGFTGRREGMAAQASATLRLPLVA
jgi:2-C-methyl-D-erythritol 4-phosphate cytidylyltransferase / 2-C-methyl-D-erythritol 2,4-cyclodiphosphate synthase